MNDNDNPAPMSVGNRGEWVMVPRQPTREMIEAVLKEGSGCTVGDSDNEWGDADYEQAQALIVAMLSASPAPPPSNGFAAGVRAAVKWVEQRRHAFEAEHGFMCPETGAMEFGRGKGGERKEEYAAELVEIEEGLAALAADPQPSASSAPEADGDRLAAACRGCAKPYSAFPLDMTIPDEQWLAINDGESGGLLCAACIVERLAKLKHAIAVRAYLETATTTKAWKIDEAMVERALAAWLGDRYAAFSESNKSELRIEMRAALEAAGLAGGALLDVFEAYKAWPADLRAKLSAHDLRRMNGWSPPSTRTSARELPEGRDHRGHESHVFGSNNGYVEYCFRCDAVETTPEALAPCVKAAAPAHPESAARQEAVAIKGVHLRRDTSGKCVVRLGIDGQWVEVIRDFGDVIDHYVATSGIAEFVKDTAAAPQLAPAQSEGEKPVTPAATQARPSTFTAHPTDWKL